MHGTVTTFGPMMWGLLALGIAACALDLFVLFDSLRRPVAAFARVPETRWPYAALSLIYVIAYAAWWSIAVQKAMPWLGMVALFGAPLSLFVGAAYLLRVVYPKPAAPARTGDGAPDDPARDGRADTH